MSDIEKTPVILSPLQQEIITHYREVYEPRVSGPQLEGLEKEWLADALVDPSTILIELEGGEQWPLLVDVKHHKDYREQFFVDHFPDERAYYFSVPPHQSIDHVIASGALQGVIEDVAARGGIIAYDYNSDTQEGDIANELLAKGSRCELIDVTPISQAYGRSYGLPSVMHFEATARQKRRTEVADGTIGDAYMQLTASGEYSLGLDHGPVLLGRDRLLANPELLNDIWNMYEDQFSELVDDHPSLQIQPKEELERMLLDDESFNVAFMEAGKVVGLCYFVSNIEKCVWLNAPFFQELHEEHPNARLSYFPGIVVDKDRARQGGGYVASMLGLVEKIIEKVGIDIQIVFQCTNISATYIPHIVTAFIAECESLEFTRPFDKDGSAFQKIAQYEYRVIKPV